MKFKYRGSSFAIIASASLLSSIAMPHEEFAGQQLVACALDIPAHCGAAKPGGGRVIECLQNHRAELSPDCKAAVTPSDFADGSQGLTIAVTIDALRAREGAVMIFLGDDPNRFPVPAKRTVIVPLAGDRVAVSFRHLKPGTYAVAAIHDANENGKYDAGEGFVASNGAVGRPTFAASAIEFENSATVALSMRYP